MEYQSLYRSLTHEEMYDHFPVIYNTALAMGDPSKIEKIYKRFSKCTRKDKREVKKCMHRLLRFCQKNNVPVGIQDHATITITVVSKEHHPWRHRIVGTNDAFAANGVPGGVIRLKRGNTYKFIIVQKTCVLGYENPDKKPVYVAGMYDTYAPPCPAGQMLPFQPQGLGGRPLPIAQAGHPFYITEDPLGGPRGWCSDNPNWYPPKLPGTPDPIRDCRTFTLTVGPTFPKAAYYACSTHPGMGGPIEVVD